MDKNRVVSSNLLWRLLERFGAQSVTLVVSIILARILDPSVYGTIALVTVITTILQVFVDSGLGTALIQKKQVDSLDFSTAFYCNIIICMVLYFGLFACAPFIASFYNNEELAPIIRVLGIILIISGFKNIQNAYISRNLLFKFYFFATLGGTISAAIVGIWMAYNGFGVWALVFQNIINQGIDTIILWVLVKWKPTKEFSFSRLKALYSYSWKLLVSSLLDTTWTQLRQLIIGKQYSTTDLAYYNKGQEYPNSATVALNSSIDSVLLPIMSKEQDSPTIIKQMTRRAIKTSSYILWPMMLGLSACSVSFVKVILTEKWLPCVPYLIIFSIVYAFYPIHTANLNAIKALGRSDLFLLLEIIKKIANLIIIIITIPFGPLYIALGSILGSVISQIINSWPNNKLLKYSYKEQISDIVPYIFLSLIMATCVALEQFLGFSDILTLIIQITTGAIVYIGLSYAIHLDSFEYCLTTIQKLIGRSK